MSDNDVRALIVYESMFGNTEKVALAIRDGLERAVDTDVVRVDRCPASLPHDVRLLVVGGPTHAFSMSRASTRADASSQGDVVMPAKTGIREWIDGLAGGSRRAVVATFDTRVTKVRRLPGSAAKAAVRALRRHGFTTIADPSSFYVDDSIGPVSDAELERAREWGELVGRELRQFISPIRRHPWRRSA
ncbi:flavodoxin family protein [Kribbella sancticallisti]|uniref:Flavodoxin family protein n=1 Tax=Kribbella sancticallisti TaxID=460087 RepID=A0ABP4QSN7_9ACTN